MTTNGTSLLAEAGVSLWLDDLSRDRLTDGSLQRLIDTHNVVGVTTNPSIFANAIGGSASYDADIADCANRRLDVNDTITSLTTHDVQLACDLFRPIFERTAGVDGRVSIEVEPDLAHDTGATVARALELSELVDRENVLIKIPATEAGLAAITEVTAHGVSVNVTLIFSLRRYREVLNAYFTGLERARQNDIDIRQIHSVASFFISRVDSAVDPVVEAVMPDRAEELRGRFGIANAAAAYEIFEQMMTTERAKWLMSLGANPQRLLWASTGVKDTRLPPDWYLGHLTAPQTVNTVPEATLIAAAGITELTAPALLETARQAPLILNELNAVGLTYDEATEQLEVEGIQKFQDSWQDLVQSVTERMGRTR